MDLRASATRSRRTPSRRRGRTSTRRSSPAPGCRRTTEARLEALADLYRDHDGDPTRAWLYRVAERLVDHDEGVALWRHHHVLMAAREIGTRRGTGGSPGVPYLKTTLDRRFFPELWDVRVRL